MRFVARSIEFHMCSSIFIHVIRTKKLDKELCRFVAYSWGGGGGGRCPPNRFFLVTPLSVCSTLAFFFNTLLHTIDYVDKMT
jgi:hypothetical protein